MTKRQKTALTRCGKVGLLAAVILAGAALSGCTGPEPIRQQCLPVPHYTLAQQHGLAAELQAHCNVTTGQCDVPEMHRRVTDLWAVQRENAACLRSAP